MKAVTTDAHMIVDKDLGSGERRRRKAKDFLPAVALIFKYSEIYVVEQQQQCINQFKGRTCVEARQGEKKHILDYLKPRK